MNNFENKLYFKEFLKSALIKIKYLKQNKKCL